MKRIPVESVKSNWNFELDPRLLQHAQFAMARGRQWDRSTQICVLSVFKQITVFPNCEKSFTCFPTPDNGLHVQSYENRIQQICHMSSTYCLCPCVQFWQLTEQREFSRVSTISTHAIECNFPWLAAAYRLFGMFFEHPSCQNAQKASVVWNGWTSLLYSKSLWIGRKKSSLLSSSVCKSILHGIDKFTCCNSGTGIIGREIIVWNLHNALFFFSTCVYIYRYIYICMCIYISYYDSICIIRIYSI